jgi:hypothetical protein
MTIINKKRNKITAHITHLKIRITIKEYEVFIEL